jgi:hypothetical protein
MTHTHPGLPGVAALQALVRARRWSLHELARQKQELDAAQASCAGRLKALRQNVADEARRQQALLEGAGFRAGDLALRRLVLAALAAEVEQVLQQHEALQAQVATVAAQMHEHRQEQVLLERVVDQRRQAWDDARGTRTAREADALVAGRRGGPGHAL